MLFDETRVPEELRIQLSGFLEPGMSHHRNMRFDELYEFVPKDASVRVGVYTSEIAPGGATAWHLHNGAGFFLVLQGRVTIEFKDTVRHYRAGDAYAEPIGVIHRAVNPETEVPFICVVSTVARFAEQTWPAAALAALNQSGLPGVPTAFQEVIDSGHVRASMQPGTCSPQDQR